MMILLWVSISVTNDYLVDLVTVNLLIFIN